MTNKEIIEIFENEGIETTNDITQAIYILTDGTLISGMFYDGDRTEDHRIIEVLFDDIDRYTDNFWQLAHERTGMIQHVPETSYILVKDGQTVTEEQKQYFKLVEHVETF
ncbi:hypothetical protein P3U41_05585 [Mammaliicoccus sciuri]|uniref:hypothetical protein n=1 Tax=Mammaliicoccus sciuri TaxID=1296 RepID=UPI002B259F6A|nr:hypothetical protein [Mammaliicoccus sciuri]WQL34240.1 hypothetical protein P3U41_05585 [Mammaliicoccus sciuri]WQL61179.1 hypothetical protein P3T96_05585 [Mammaliicoccus sciuri]